MRLPMLSEYFLCLAPCGRVLGPPVAPYVLFSPIGGRSGTVSPLAEALESWKQELELSPFYLFFVFCSSC